jgi:hypothetical protein
MLDEVTRVVLGGQPANSKIADLLDYDLIQDLEYYS